MKGSNRIRAGRELDQVKLGPQIRVLKREKEKELQSTRERTDPDKRVTGTRISAT